MVKAAGDSQKFHGRNDQKLWFPENLFGSNRGQQAHSRWPTRVHGPQDCHEVDWIDWLIDWFVGLLLDWLMESRYL